MCAFVFQVLCELHELRVLYLHGNSIWNLLEVDKLGELQYLHTITLHGNTIETHKGYRWRLHFLPKLTYTHILPGWYVWLLLFAAIASGS